MHLRCNTNVISKSLSCSSRLIHPSIIIQIGMSSSSHWKVAATGRAEVRKHHECLIMFPLGIQGKPRMRGSLLYCSKEKQWYRRSNFVSVVAPDEVS